MQIAIVATTDASMPAPFTIKPHPDTEQSLGIIFTIDYPSGVVFLPGTSLEPLLIKAFQESTAKQSSLAASSVPPAVPVGSTLSDAKHMFHTCDGKSWYLRQISGDHSKHTLALLMALPLLRLLGFTTLGRARHIAFFLTTSSYTLDATHIRKLLYSIPSMLNHSPAIWLGISGLHIYEVMKINAFIDPDKFRMFVQLQFLGYDADDQVSLTLGDFVSRPTFWPYNGDDHEHICAGIEGLERALLVLGGHSLSESDGLRVVLARLRDPSEGLRKEYSASVFDYIFRQALREFSQVMREDSTSSISRASMFKDQTNTGPMAIVLLQKLMLDRMGQKELDRYSAGLPRYLQTEKEEIANAKRYSGTGGVDRPPKKLKTETGAPDDTNPIPCNRDILHHLNIKAKDGKIPNACSSTNCRYSHPSKGMFKGWGLEKIRVHAELHCSDSVKSSVLSELDGRIQRKKDSRR